jgi:hypothetical protein
MPPAPRTANTPRPRRGPVRPSNIFYVLMRDHAVTSGRRDRASLSLSALCGHPATAAPRRALWRHPGAVGTCGDKTSPQRPLCHVRASRQRHPRIDPPRRPVNRLLCRNPRSHSCTSTVRTTTPLREWDSPGRLSAPQHCSPYRNTYRNSAARMLTAPSLAYKRRGSLPAAGERQGDNGQQTLMRSPPSPRYWHLPQSPPLGHGGHAFSPTTLVATPLRAPRCN